MPGFPPVSSSMTGPTREYHNAPPPPNDRSDSAEPWDERGDTTTTTSNNTPVTTTTSTTLGKKRLDLSSPLSVVDGADMRRDQFVYEEEPELEDGDLPTLSLTRSTSTNQNRTSAAAVAAATTTATLNNNPSDGGSEMRRQRDFWKQLDSSPSTMSGEGSLKARQGLFTTRNNKFDDDGLPQETRAPSQLHGARNTPDNSNANGGGFNPHLQMAASEDSDDTRESKEFEVVDGEDTNFCDPLSAMEAICGDGGLVASICGVAPGGEKGAITPGTDSTEDHGRPKARNLNILNAVRDEGDSVDEHTAIEVEYVEPEETNGVAQDRPENWSPSRKNAYLAAMARKAKEDFERSQAREMASSNKNPATEKRNGGSITNGGMTTTTPEVTNDVYNSFGAADKRKFLRFINSGMTPKESAERVLAEKDKAKESKPIKKGATKLFTKFWKKGSSKNKASNNSVASNSVELAKADISRETLSFDESFPQEEKKEEDRMSTEEEEIVVPPLQKPVAPSSIAYSSSSDNASASNNNNNPRGYSASQSQSQSHSSYDDARKDSQSESSASAAKQAPKEQVEDQNVSSASKEPTPDVQAASSIDSSDDSVGAVPSDSPVIDASPGFSAAVSPIAQHSHENARDVTLSSASTPDSSKVTKSPEGGRFAVSGINYYDAVRREASESEAEDDPDSSNMIPSSMNRSRSSQRGSRLGQILHSPKLTGFSKLSKGGSKEEEQQKAAVVTPESPKDRGDIANVSFDVTDAKSPSSTQSEEEALGKMEDVLLRPVGTLSAKKSSVVQEETMSPEAGNGNDTSTSTQSQLLNSSEIDVAFDIQEYLHATEGYSQHSVSVDHGNESMSVMSGKSGPAGSVYTQASTLTQSSRKRRPGAAKTRLAKAKEAEKHAAKPKGWHESIRAAAETNNRVWKPKQGWVGYQEPSDQGSVNLSFAPEDQSVQSRGTESMHLNLPVGKNRTRLEDSSVAESTPGHHEPPNQGRSPDAVHSDAPGEKEELSSENLSTPTFSKSAAVEAFRDRNPKTLTQEAPSATHSQMDYSEDTINHSQPLKTDEPFRSRMDLDDISVEQSVAYSVEQFVQSVGSSSPVRPSRKKTTASPLRTQRLSGTPSKQSGWVDSMRKATSNIGKDGQHWDPESGWVDAKGEPVGDAYNPPSAHHVRDASQKPHSEVQEQSPEKSQNRNDSSNLPKSTGSKEKSNGATEKNGHEDNAGTPIQAPREESNKIDQSEKRGKVDKDPSILTARGFLSPGTLKKTPTINVVREKVDDADLSWFPPSRRGSNAGSNKNKNDQSKATGAFDLSQASTDKGTPTRSVRSSGPVDVDEVDNMYDDSYDDEEGVDDEGVVWNGVVFESDREEITPARTVEPAANAASTQYTSDSSKAGSSATSLSQFSKMVPKLSSSKKDTSPIRGGRASKSQDADPRTSTKSPAESNTAGMSRSLWRNSNSPNAPPETQASNSKRTDYGPTSQTPKGQDAQSGMESAKNSRSVFASPRQFVKLANATAKVTTEYNDYGPAKTPVANGHYEDFTTRAPEREFGFDSHDANAQHPPASPTHSASSSSVKLLAQQFERSKSPTEMRSSEGRPSGESNRLNAATAEWKSFLGKKVQKEQGARYDQVDHSHMRDPLQQNDSLFEFSLNDETSVDSSFAPRAVGAGKGKPRNSNPPTEVTDTEPTDGSDYSDGNEVNKTFLTRLASCAAPIRAGGQDALAHLTFLRTNDKNGSSRFMPQYLCGRPDVIVEENEGEGDYSYDEKTAEIEATKNSVDLKTPTREDPKTNHSHSLHLTSNSNEKHEGKSDTHSVLSEDFGAKTAYLEALAMKTAVSKPRKSDSRKRRSSTGSEVSATSSTVSHKEKWRDFLDRKASAGTNPGRARQHGSETSTAAESYAAKKVEEMMAMMAARPKSTPRSWRSSDEPGEDQGHFPGNQRPNNIQDSLQNGKQSRYTPSNDKNESMVDAAEELASARVNAMMQALSNDASALDECEI